MCAGGLTGSRVGLRQPRLCTPEDYLTRPTPERNRAVQQDQQGLGASFSARNSFRSTWAGAVTGTGKVGRAGQWVEESEVPRSLGFPFAPRQLLKRCGRSCSKKEGSVGGSP